MDLKQKQALIDEIELFDLETINYRKVIYYVDQLLHGINTEIGWFLPGTRNFFRARRMDTNNRPKNQSELGAPPPEKSFQLSTLQSSQ